MGQEKLCKARFGGQESEGTAMLETGHVLFRGAFRVKLTFAEMTSVTSKSGSLTLGSKRGPLILDLGAAADKWAGKILNPPTRLDKLGVKGGSSLALAGTFEKGFEEELRRAGAVIAAAEALCDLVLYACPARAGLERIPDLTSRLKPAGGLWIVYPKGVQEITEIEVINSARASGLKDVKVASFSRAHTALKFVIPVAARK